MNLTTDQIKYADVELAETNRILEHAERNLLLAVTRTPTGNLLSARLDELLECVRHTRRLIAKTRENAVLLGNTQPEPGRL